MCKLVPSAEVELLYRKPRLIYMSVYEVVVFRYFVPNSIWS